MCAEFVKSYNVTDGIVASEATPSGSEALYASPQELTQLFGCSGVTEADIRFAMGLIHSHCNRASLWPTEVLEGPYEIPTGRQETRLHVTPVIQILEAAGRFGLARRDRQGWNNLYQGLNPLLVLAGSGLPQWTPLDVSLIECDAASGILYLPLSGMLMPYSMIRIRAISGFISIPFRIKTALAELINSTHAKGVSDRTRYSAGRITRQYAGTSFITPLAEQMLQPFVVRALF